VRCALARFGIFAVPPPRWRCCAVRTGREQHSLAGTDAQTRLAGDGMRRGNPLPHTTVVCRRRSAPVMASQLG
jgi:hypothetical protein